MKVINTIWKWLIRNFGNVFSILGFFLTIYFGIYYVPSYLRESQNERLKNAQNEIQQSVKELVFSDSTFTIVELTSLVHAKEISLNEKFPLSLSDILTKAEESFMEARYLPLTKRRDLIQKIETIKQQFPKEIVNSDGRQKAEKKGASLWLELLSIIVTIITVVIGIISSVIKYQADKDKQEEINNELQEIPINNDLRESAYQFERKIESILKDHSDIELLDTARKDRGIDFEFTHRNKHYFLEAKYLSRSKIGLNTFQQLSYFLKDKTGEGWLIYNTDLTPLVAKHIEDFNKSNPQAKIKTIRVTNANEFEKKLNQLLKE